MPEFAFSDEYEEAIRKIIVSEAAEKALEDPKFALDWYRYQKSLNEPVNDFWQYTETIDY